MILPLLAISSYNSLTVNLPWPLTPYWSIFFLLLNLNVLNFGHKFQHLFNFPVMAFSPETNVPGVILQELTEALISLTKPDTTWDSSFEPLLPFHLSSQNKVFSSLSTCIFSLPLNSSHRLAYMFPKTHTMWDCCYFSVAITLCSMFIWHYSPPQGLLIVTMSPQPLHQLTFIVKC